MTRINVVPVQELTVRHLCAEYRELPRVFGLAYNASMSKRPWTDKQPKTYTLGTGHVLFFYDKLMFLSDRHQQIVKEMLSRGYKPTMQNHLACRWAEHIPSAYWKNYMPTEDALRVNRERIAERLLK